MTTVLVVRAHDVGGEHRHGAVEAVKTEAAVPIRTDWATRLDPAAPVQAKAFAPFADELKIRWDEEFVYVEGDSFPQHPMMVGITAWNQQVPLPQDFTGENRWKIPRNPVQAENPVSAKQVSRGRDPVG